MASYVVYYASINLLVRGGNQDVLAFYEHQDKQWYWHIMMGF